MAGSINNRGESNGTLIDRLEKQGVSRRDFLAYCTWLASMIAVGPALTSQVRGEDLANKLAIVKDPVMVWLQLQECTGCIESTIRSGSPDIGSIICQLVSLNYIELLMGSAGNNATAALEAASAIPHVLVVNGSIPLLYNGAACTIGGKSARQVLESAAKNATAVLAVGDCAYYGCVQAAHPNPTRAVGVQNIITDKPVVNVPGCPPIADVITATIAYYLTYGTTPPMDGENRPLFAYKDRIHDNCPRRAHFDAGQYVEVFDDEGSRNGWCLYKVGCKGPDTYAPCPVIRWNGALAFPISAGHPCLGCTMRDWVDRSTPFYQQLKDVPGVPVEATANKVGGAAVALTTGIIAVHAVGTYLRHSKEQQEAAREVTSLPILGDELDTPPRSQNQPRGKKE